MNHILLPDGQGSRPNSAGVNSMEVLINALIKLGAKKARLKAKLFGGARMVAGLSDIGALNSDFSRRFLRAEGIDCIGESLGGTSPRRIQFWPYHGRVRQRISENREFGDECKPTSQIVENDVELF
ncbi:MAG: chemotaxis protein CheD [Halocynthiibacter sp.]